MKKRLILIAILSMALSWNLQAQLLWMVSGNGLTKASYLFGTHHLIEKEQIKGLDQIMSICNQADAVVGEIDIRDSNLQTKIMQATIMADEDIMDLVSTEDYTMIDAEFKSLIGVGMDHLGKMEPAMLDNIFVIMHYLKENGMSKQPKAIDLIFQENATNNNKKVISLESVEDQINALFNSLSLKRQAEILIKDVKKQQKGTSLFKKLNEYYLAGNLDSLEILNNKDDSMTKEEKKVIEDDRNIKWAKELPGLMKEQSCFVAVGFLHLTGKTGLIKLLMEAGYSVKPVIIL